jgi:hypothetical protein
MILPFQWGNESNIVTEYFLPRLSVGVQMKKWIFGIVILFGLAGCRAQESRPFPNAPAIKRLDGSLFTAAEIDGT